MSWLSERQTVAKCRNCGKFVAEQDAYYAKDSHTDDSGFVSPYCGRACAASATLALVPVPNPGAEAIANLANRIRTINPISEDMFR